MRKELWRFRCWDYSHNLDLFLKSLEMTADALSRPDCVTECGNHDAQEIRKFIRLIRASEEPYEEAQRLLGIDYDVFEAISKERDGDFLSNTQFSLDMRDWTKVQKDYELVTKVAYKIEQAYWKNAWKFFARKGRGWWE